MATNILSAAPYHNDAGKHGAAFGRRLPGRNISENTSMLWTIIVILFILWLLGFSLHIGGGLIHLVLVLAVIVLIFNLLTGRRGI